MAKTLNINEMRPAAMGVWILVREETEADGSVVVYQYLRAALKDPGKVAGIQQNDKGNVTLATVGQKAPMLPIVFPSGIVAVAPATTFSCWSPVVTANGEPMNLPVKVKREA